jgi:hypothetical protein
VFAATGLAIVMSQPSGMLTENAARQHFRLEESRRHATHRRSHLCRRLHHQPIRSAGLTGDNGTAVCALLKVKVNLD